jgi:hypothetical protein
MALTPIHPGEHLKEELEALDMSAAEPRIFFSRDETIEFTDKVTLDETSSSGPALGSYRDRLFLSWNGVGNNKLNVIYSLDRGRSFMGRYTSPETSRFAPALVSHGNALFIAWTGQGDDHVPWRPASPQALRPVSHPGFVDSGGTRQSSVKKGLHCQ